MASMRRLNRRLARWVRYDARYAGPERIDTARGFRTVKASPGFARAWRAVMDEYERRQLIRFYPADGQCYCNGCVGMGPCDDELGDRDDAWQWEPDDDDDAFDDEGYPWPPGVVLDHASAERDPL